MDNVDNMILNILRKNARVANKKIAELVHLTPPAVTARIKKLEKTGVIEGYSTIINAKKINKTIMARINLIHVRGTRQQLIDLIESNENILSYEHITGRYSLSVKMLVSNTSQIENFIAKLQKYATTETLIVMSTTRTDNSLYIFD